jgi:hypothetical protein
MSGYFSQILLIVDKKTRNLPHLLIAPLKFNNCFTHSFQYVSNGTGIAILEAVLEQGVL